MWEDKIPVDTKEFMIAPTVYLLRDSGVSDAREMRSIKISLENFYVSEGQVLTLEIIDGHLRMRVFLKTE